MKLLCNVLSVALLTATTANSQKAALDPDEVPSRICGRELRNHVLALDVCSSFSFSAPYGNRAPGSSGFEESANHVVRQIRRQGRLVTHRIQLFHYVYQKLNSIRLEGPDGKLVDVSSVYYNTGTLDSGVSGDLVAVPVGCYKDQWRNIKVRGRIVLIKGGQCSVTDKAKLAKRYRARAILLYDQPTNSSLKRKYANALVPVGIVSPEVGQKWIEQLRNGDTLPVKLHVKVTTHRPTISRNIIAETTTGSRNDIIMIGARLDSPGGAGLNDNGSGTSALIGILQAMNQFTNYSRRVRFAWWGGNTGSAEYVARLSTSEAAKIRVYLDVNTIATHNASFSIFSHEVADKMVAGSILADYLTKRSGVNVTYSEPDEESDTLPFRRLKIPCSGITTGADECKGLPCDDSDNFNTDVMRVATRAMAFTIAKLAGPYQNKTTIHRTDGKGKKL